MRKEAAGRSDEAAAGSSGGGRLGLWSSKTLSCWERIHQSLHSVGLQFKELHRTGSGVNDVAIYLVLVYISVHIIWKDAECKMILINLSQQITVCVSPLHHLKCQHWPKWQKLHFLWLLVNKSLQVVCKRKILPSGTITAGAHVCHSRITLNLHTFLCDSLLTFVCTCMCVAVWMNLTCWFAEGERPWSWKSTWSGGDKSTAWASSPVLLNGSGLCVTTCATGSSSSCGFV